MCGGRKYITAILAWTPCTAAAAAVVETVTKYIRRRYKRFREISSDLPRRCRRPSVASAARTRCTRAGRWTRHDRKWLPTCPFFRRFGRLNCERTQPKVQNISVFFFPLCQAVESRQDRRWKSGKLQHPSFLAKINTRLLLLQRQGKQRQATKQAHSETSTF